MKKLTERITKFKQLNNEIFSILNKYLQGPQDKEEFAYKVQLKELSPPTSDTAAASGKVCVLDEQNNNSRSPRMSEA